MLIHSNILYAAGVSGYVSFRRVIVYGKVSALSGPDTHETDIVRIIGLTAGAVISSIWAK